MPTYEKVTDESIKKISLVEQHYAIGQIEDMIKNYDMKISELEVEKAEWIALKAEAAKLGVVVK